MTDRELAAVTDVDVEFEPESYSLFEAAREEWALWLGAVAALVATIVAANSSLTASAFDLFLFATVAVVVTLIAAGRTAQLSDVL